MNKHILFIHGAGSGAYEEDKLLVNRLEKELGMAYTIHYPAMYDESNAPYDMWKEQIEELLATFRTPIILIGHSVGASHLAKILTELNANTRILGVFLLDAPFWGGGGWQYEGYKELELPHDKSMKIPRDTKMFIYHTQNDDVVPFNHLYRYAQLIPQATIREIKSGGHQLSDDVSLVIDDIRNLNAR